ncbi:hypothetical protein ACA910_022367 [Epithemia clementina (nom. ined.)]
MEITSSTTARRKSVAFVHKNPHASLTDAAASSASGNRSQEAPEYSYYYKIFASLLMDPATKEYSLDKLNQVLVKKERELISLASPNIDTVVIVGLPKFSYYPNTRVSGHSHSQDKGQSAADGAAHTFNNAEIIQIDSTQALQKALFDHHQTEEDTLVIHVEFPDKMNLVTRLLEREACLRRDMQEQVARIEQQCQARLAELEAKLEYMMATTTLSSVLLPSFAPESDQESLVEEARNGTKYDCLPQGVSELTDREASDVTRKEVGAQPLENSSQNRSQQRKGKRARRGKNEEGQTKTQVQITFVALYSSAASLSGPCFSEGDNGKNLLQFGITCGLSSWVLPKTMAPGMYRAVIDYADANKRGAFCVAIVHQKNGEDNWEEKLSRNFLDWNGHSAPFQATTDSSTWHSASTGLLPIKNHLMFQNFEKRLILTLKHASLSGYVHVRSVKLEFVHSHV